MKNFKNLLFVALVSISAAVLGQTKITLHQHGSIRERKIYKRNVQREARPASTHRQQFNNIRSLRSKNPHRPIFNPYTQRSLYKNKRCLKHKRNRKYKDIEYKFTYKQQQEREQNPVQKKSEGVLKRKNRKGKDQQA